MSTGSERPSDEINVKSRKGAPSKRIIVGLLLLSLAVVGVAVGSMWAYLQYLQPVEDTSMQDQNADSARSLDIPEQTPDNIIDSKTSEFLAKQDPTGLKTYYQGLIAEKSDSGEQAGLHLRLAQALFMAYPDDQKADILAAAYKAEELAPTATTANYISVIEKYYGNESAASKYDELYISRIGDMTGAE